MGEREESMGAANFEVALDYEVTGGVVLEVAHVESLVVQAISCATRRNDTFLPLFPPYHYPTCRMALDR